MLLVFPYEQSSQFRSQSTYFSVSLWGRKVTCLTAALQANLSQTTGFDSVHFIATLALFDFQTFENLFQCAVKAAFPSVDLIVA